MKLIIAFVSLVAYQYYNICMLWSFLQLDLRILECAKLLKDLLREYKTIINIVITIHGTSKTLIL